MPQERREIGMAGSIGAPSFKWTDEIEEEIFTRIMRGEGIAKILGPKRNKGLPGDTLFYKRLAADAAFAERYTRAREVQAETLADEIISIADDDTGDWSDGEDGPRLNAEHIQRSRLRVDARKWTAAKLAPKKYGDKVQQEIGGPDGGEIPMSLSIKFDRP